MFPFEYDRPTQQERVIDALSHSNRTKILAGGTNLVDLMKNGVEQPERLVDINRLDLTTISQLGDGGVRLGALAHNSAGFPQCNKRMPGSGCGAIEGFNRIHAILGSSTQCVATPPSDMCVALAALDATVRVQSSKGVRTIEFRNFHRLPGDTPRLDTNLEADELIHWAFLQIASMCRSATRSCQRRRYPRVQ